MARQLHILDPEEFLDRIDAPSAWSSSRYSCFYCLRRDHPTTITTAGRMCSACILRLFDTRQELKNLHLGYRKEAPGILAAEDAPSRKLIILNHFKELYPDGVTGPDAYREAVHRGLVSALGSGGDHPLAKDVRKAAFLACRHLGPGLLPYLLAEENPAPKQRHAGIILVAGSIAPADPEVRGRIEQAAAHEAPEVRSAAAEVLEDIDDEWSQPLLAKLAEDPDPTVQDACHSFIDRRRRKARKAELEAKIAARKPRAPKDRFQELVAEHYSAADLQAIVPFYFKSFIPPKKKKKGGKKAVGKRSKPELARTVAGVLRDPKRLAKWLKKMPENLRSLLTTLTFRPAMMDAGTVEQETGMAVFLPDPSRDTEQRPREIAPAFRLFQNISDVVDLPDGKPVLQYYFYLDDDLREIFREHLAPPPDYHIGPATAVEETAFRFEDRGRLLARLPMVSEYVRQGHLRLSKRGRKILVPSIRKMAEVCGIDEFYTAGDASLGCMRTQLLADFLLRNPAGESLSDAAAWKRLIARAFLGNASDDYPLHRLLDHLNQVQRAEALDGRVFATERRADIAATLLAMLRDMPAGEWVSASRCLAYAAYRLEKFEVLNPILAGEYVYFTGERAIESDGNSVSAIEEHPVDHPIYVDAVIEPFVKAVLFLCGSLGLLDLAYDPPTNQRYRLSGKPYLSRYDGLRYVRLTELGAYVVGLSDACSQKAAPPPRARVVLDENRLIIHLDIRDPIKAVALEALAERISDTCFRMGFDSFLRGCDHEAEIQKRIDQFKGMVDAPFPLIWEDFLKAVEGRVTRVTPRDGLQVFQLRPDPDLLDLLARDKVLKKYVLKAEKHHVIIRSRDISRVRHRLAALGYFWSAE